MGDRPLTCLLYLEFDWKGEFNDGYCSWHD
jgi:hypothetical protein